MTKQPSTIVFGLGNPILGDDGIGIHVVYKLQKRFESRKGFEWLSFKEGALGGLELVDEVTGYERMILLDAIQTEGGVAGEIYEMGIEDFRTTLHASNPHNMDFITALKIGEKYYNRGVPTDIKIFVMEVVSVLEFKEEFSEPVEKAFPSFIDRVEKYILEL